MAEPSRIRLASLRRTFCWSGGAAVLLIALAVGCHRSDSPADSVTSSADASGGSVAKPSASPKASGPDLLGGGEKPGTDNSSQAFPKPKFVRRKLVTAQFPDKTPQANWTVKVYSDGSEVYDGPHTEFYFNGNKLMEGQYVEGKQEGQWKFWSENGKLIKTETYRNGKLDGSWTLYRDNGSKERDVSFKAGKRDGKWIFYDAAGKNQPVEQHEYKASSDKTGDNPDGTWIKWYPDGRKQSEIHYKDGLVDGTQTLWYKNGQMQEVQSFKNGVPDGKRIRWKQNGEKIDESDFQNGRPIVSDATGEK